MMGQSNQHFIVMMIPHHDRAIAMADLALKRAQHSEINKLAETIKITQTKEIQQMQGWYKQWYGTEVPDWGPGGLMMMPPSGMGSLKSSLSIEECATEP